ncbi:Pentatricopeptide repeat-containing protein [Vitis vinifera]|nr:Pentatricopeptide repeat-containing protein [Vitis vinifera]
MLEQIVERLREEGYKPKLGDLLLDLEDKEKETAIHHHSEKLAVTFGLISTKPGMTIRIVKNLRVCEDCHTVIKLISKVYAREILMRDRTRFHLFKDGNCTCGDYW